MFFYPSMSGVQNTRRYYARILGVTTSLTVQEANGMTITRTGAGIYKVVWTDNPYQFLTATYGFMATTVADLKNFSVVFEDYTASTKTMNLTVYNASGTATDLAATQRLCMEFAFEESGY